MCPMPNASHIWKLHIPSPSWKKQHRPVAMLVFFSGACKQRSRQHLIHNDSREENFKSSNQTNMKTWDRHTVWLNVPFYRRRTLFLTQPTLQPWNTWTFIHGDSRLVSTFSFFRSFFYEGVFYSHLSTLCYHNVRCALRLFFFLKCPRNEC